MEDSNDRDSQYRREALEMGWIPPEKYKGDPDRFVSAEEFVEKGRNFIPILRKNNEKLQGQIGSIKSELDQTKAALNDAIGALKEFKKFHEESSKQAYERARRELLSQKRDALTEGDFDKSIQIDETINKMDRQMEKMEATPTPKVEEKKVESPILDPVMQQWVQENADWYGKDAAKTSYANSIAYKVREENPTAIGLEFLNLVKEEVEERFGVTEKQERTSKVDGGRQASRSTSLGSHKLSYADLDPAAKKICDRYGEKLVGENKAYKSMDEWRKHYCESIQGEV